MILLWLGIGLWSALHFMPSLARGIRTSLIESIGETKYKIGFALAVVGSIVLMVKGWGATSPVDIYDPPSWGADLNMLFVLVAFILLAMAKLPTNIKRLIRHPQLTGLVVWSVGHLLANGNNRSLLLFGGLGIWALIEMKLLNRRDGTWVRPDAVPLKAEVIPVVIGIVLYAVFLFAHSFLFGVSPLDA
ncbi:MAG: NnrU family protein [Alphaproteobacteria bacterium]